MISLVLDIVGAALLFAGLVLLTVSVYGLLRIPDTLSQLHAQGLATGPGVIAVLASSIATENAAIIAFAILAIAFMVASSPAAGHAIARSADRRSQPAREPRDEPDGERDV
ncbi:sodium:proton antiporter [Mycobacterium sp. GA-1199]|uniref:cation:proton antiporter n=1 Tax=Mycobacterium sp. GA-1199 TaxID=1772287 RepID=UPI00074B035A|nr:monovalent cation/H(+) antiporter subunit G [Mycobacterium sp. GA-1199]KUI48504.1 sodium:proton antiporter [Mycobacterium sp. GA-1199]